MRYGNTYIRNDTKQREKMFTRIVWERYCTEKIPRIVNLNLQ